MKHQYNLRESYEHFRRIGKQVFEEQVGRRGLFVPIFPDGNLRWFERLDPLGRIDMPTLIIHGTEDDTTPRMGEAIQASIPGSNLVIVEGGHMHFWSNPRSRAEIARHLRAVMARPK